MDQEQRIELLTDKIRHPRKYEHICIPQLPGLYDCIVELRTLGITRRINASLSALYERIERENNSTTLEKAFIYKPKTIL